MWLEGFPVPPHHPPLRGRQDDERKKCMDNRGKRQASSIFGGMGFYIALLVCVLAAGVVGYFALLDNNTVPQEDPKTQSVDRTEPTPPLSVSKDNETPSQSVMSEEPVVVQRPVSPPAQTTTPKTPDPEPEVPASTNEPEEEALTVVAPLNGETVAVFSIDQLTYDPTLGDWRTHDGIDIQAAAGSEVAAAAPGTVRSVEKDDRLGTTVIIDHLDGYTTTYASLQSEVTVLAGDQVSAGDVIGTVGNTSLSEAGLGAHLHFSVMKDGLSVDPNAFLEQ